MGRHGPGGDRVLCKVHGCNLQDTFRLINVRSLYGLESWAFDPYIYLPLNVGLMTLDF